MSEDNNNPAGSQPAGGETDDPVAELRNLEKDTSPVFLSMVRKKIHRRTAVSHVATYSWHLPKVLLVEMLAMIAHLLNALGSRKGTQP